MPSHPKSINYSSFSGLDNVNDPEGTNPSFLKKALNINVDKTGGLSKRKGYTLHKRIELFKKIKPDT